MRTPKPKNIARKESKGKICGTYVPDFRDFTLEKLTKNSTPSHLFFPPKRNTETGEVVLGCTKLPPTL